MIYILDTYFEYGTAGANRQLGYAKGFLSQGFQSSIVTFCVHRPKGFIPPTGISLYGLYATRMNGPRLIRGFVAIFTLVYFLLFTIKKEDKLLVCGCEFYFPIIFLLRSNNIYYEITEGPGIINKRYETSRTYLKYCNRFTKIFPISSNLKNWFLARGFDESKLKVINMTVDSSRFDKVEKKRAQKYLAYCGSVGNVKDGVDKLIQAFELYHKHFSDRKLYIIGPIASDAVKQEYETYICNHQLESFVVFTGAILPSEMPELLCNAEMLLLTRPNNEQALYGFPTKLGEYLLTGNPVIVTNVGNISDFLEDNKSAYIVQPDCIEQFVEKMILVSTKPRESLIVGENGKTCALQNFDCYIESKKVLHAMNLINY